MQEIIDRTELVKRTNWIALDGLRGLSIIFVAAVHLWAHASSDGRGGGGVKIAI